MSESLQALMTVQGMLTAVSGGFNALYFAGYSTSHPARKIATLVLARVNLSFLLQGLYWGLYWTVLPASNGSSNPLGSGSLLLVGLITLMSSLAITALILRQRFNGRRKG
ncbi:MAG: hypothetical protein O2783_01005 [Chloroflexi bacterium]|nr:hypothetical protein [Chloroflexota bacterium]